MEVNRREYIHSEYFAKSLNLNFSRDGCPTEMLTEVDNMLRLKFGSTGVTVPVFMTVCIE